MLVRTSSGRSSVGHLQLAPHLASAFRADFSFSLDGTFFPVHPLLLCAHSSFFSRFFSFLKTSASAEGEASLDSLAADLPLTPTRFDTYLRWIYHPMPELELSTVAEALDQLRLAIYFEDNPFRLAVENWLSAAVATPVAQQADALAVLQAASTHKLRRLTADCLAVFAARFDMAPVLDLLDLELAKALLTAVTTARREDKRAAPTAAADGMEAAENDRPKHSASRLRPRPLAATGAHNTLPPSDVAEMSQRLKSALATQEWGA